jgi:hypothetical protein
MRRLSGIVIAIAALVVVGVAACGSSQPASSAAATTTETPPSGDIPDSTVYVAYRTASGHVEVKVPQGWARTVDTSGAVFTDKLNTIRLKEVPAATAPTVATARDTEAPKVKSAGVNVRIGDISTVTRKAGTAVLIKYTVDSAPDPVTGKVVHDAVERYEFFRNGTEVVLTLSGPVGADNVDPWRIVTDSLAWVA